MADQNAFEKLHVEERDKADLSGVLEQLNLPPSVIEFVRKKQRIITICIGIIAIIVIVWSLYGSYVDKKIATSSSALSTALKAEDDRIAALENVINQYSGTDSALWAKIEIAQHFAEKKEYENSLVHYRSVQENLKTSDALYPLVVFGIAQLEETRGNYDTSLSEYNTLKKIKGFEGLAYTGAARLYEAQNKYSDAIKQLEEYQGVLISESSAAAEKDFISNKINRLKALM